MVMISKKADIAEEKLQDMRPLAIKSNLTKIIEQKMIEKLKKCHEHLIHTSLY